MNELDVLHHWRPADPATHATRDHEATARAALDARMANVTVSEVSTGRRLVGRAVLASAVTVALVAGGVVIARRTLDDAADNVRRVHVGAGTLDHPADGAPMNILVVGSDSRAFVRDSAQASAFGTPEQEGGQRSDTMILVRIDGDRATAVWLPRDVMVPDGTHGRVQLNSFFNRGPAAAIAAVRDLTGEPVDHFVQVDFASFVRVVDALGGVRMYVPAPMRDLYSGLDLPVAGCRTLDGAAALAWARSRHAQSFTDGHWNDVSPRADLDRIARQQALLRAIGAQTSAGVGDDPVAARKVLDRVFPSLTVDMGMDRDTVESFAGLLVRPTRVSMVTAPNEPDAEPGRLRLLDRPAGEDFFTWATQPAANASGVAPVDPSPSC
jgi:LCP family protein required for cell wall assembly